MRILSNDELTIINNEHIHATGESKFTEVIDASDNDMVIEVLTPTGWESVTASNKTVVYQEWVLTTDERRITAADHHLLFERKNGWVHLNTLKPLDEIRTEYGWEVVTNVSPTDSHSEMYDLSVNGEQYYTNGFLSHNTTTLALVALHTAIFNPDSNVGITSFTVANVKDFIGRIRYTYENLADWLKPPVKIYNTTSIEFTNNSYIYGQVTSENALRGRTNNLVIVDEFAFVAQDIANEFYTALMPSLSADGEASSAKAVFISTPNGTTGLFANMAFGAMAGENGFKYHLVDHNRIQGRTPEWRAKMIKQLGINRYQQEFECKWLSDSGTLVNSQVLEEIKTIESVQEIGNLSIFVDSFQGRTLAMAMDVGEGIGKDNHAFQVYDINTFEQVAEYAHNYINQHEYVVEIIKTMGYMFDNGAAEIYYGVENNGVGNGVMRLIERSDSPILDRAQMISSSNADGIVTKNGISMNVRTKAEACSQLKEVIESNKLQIASDALLAELKFFVRTGNTYKAERGTKDDRVMALVILMCMLIELADMEESVNTMVNDINIDDEDDEVWGMSFL